MSQMKIKCPECGNDLGEPINCDINSIGWNCWNCNIKIYKETDWNDWWNNLDDNTKESHLNFMNYGKLILSGNRE